MPLFDYKCQKCEQVFEVFSRVAKKGAKCRCGGTGNRIYSLARRRANPESPIWSASMGINPDQISEMKKIFPHHEYHPETGDLRVNNYEHQKKLAKELGMAVLA